MKPRRQQVWVIGEELPEDGEQPLVRPEHLPDGLDPRHDSVVGDRVAAELLVDHPFPRVELEDGLHRSLAEIDEAARVVPADLVHP